LRFRIEVNKSQACPAAEKKKPLLGSPFPMHKMSPCLKNGVLPFFKQGLFPAAVCGDVLCPRFAHEWPLEKAIVEMLEGVKE
jgi:hypothetical protein